MAGLRVLMAFRLRLYVAEASEAERSVLERFKKA